MFKMWAKEYDDNHKIIKNQTFEFKQDFDVRHLYAYMTVICNEFKTETPMVLTSHYVTFNNFNKVKFSKSDFIDGVGFKFLSVELID
ncbi:MAG: hypothetical protein IKR12_01035 [Clostridia bacterium]|nr:hypothetical protein [Clostridia bacterium]